MMKKRVFSGMRPTGRLHLGNYLGALKGMIALQDNSEYESIYMVVDVHAITTPYDITSLKEGKKTVILDYLAAGLNPEKSIITIQSMVPQHTELAFYLSSVATIARMQHLPTYKEKVKLHPHHNTMALLNYPILMAADILAYKTYAVPIGKDQEPHLEITREIAKKMNGLYGTDFPEPTTFETTGNYIPSLLGEGKMSKSVEGSYITLMDDLETIKSRLAKVPTDMGTGNGVPTEGSVANLFKFVGIFQGEEKRKEYETLYTTTGVKYNPLKENLAAAIFKELTPIQEKRAELAKNTGYVDDIIETGAKKARAIAQTTVDEVKEKMGLM